MSYYVSGHVPPGPRVTSLIGPPRREIRDLKDDLRQFPLFIYALATIMKPEHRPKAARFADIGGIHGLPYERWSGDVTTEIERPAAGTFGGYCYHESVLFPTWHRPYLLVIEQSIGEVAVRLADDWTRPLPKGDPEIQKWKTAAKELRFPFWDWTDKGDMKNGLPEVLHPQTFTFDLPKIPGQDRKPLEVDNPLALYDFRSRHPDGFSNVVWHTPLAPTETISYFKDWERTYRWPSAKKNPTDDYVKIKQKLADQKGQRGSIRLLRDQVSKLFTYPPTTDKGREATTWDEFSNTSFESFESKGDGGWGRHHCGSLEIPHNTVHLVVGGIGVMSDNDYAAFDPIFYLHHSNIDRILAFWEYVYDKYWMGDGYKRKKSETLYHFKQIQGTWAANEEKEIHQNTPLQPFLKKEDGPYWTSDKVRLKNILGYYTYPDIGEVKLSATAPDEAKRGEYIGILQQHFSNSSPTSLSDETFGPILMRIHENVSPVGFEIIPNYVRFAVEATLAAHAFHGSYCVQLLYKTEVIGLFSVLSRGDNTHCDACIARNKSGAKLYGVVDIPDDVVLTVVKEFSGRSPLSSLQTSIPECIKFLKKSTSVRIVGPGDALLAVADTRSDTVPLQDDFIPTLKLLSASAAIKTPRHRNSPVQFFDWHDHGDVLLDDSKWRSA